MPIYISPQVPEQATSAVTTSSRPCTTCSKPATLKCGACSSAYNDNSIAWYCSKECQKAHWKRHKPDCKLGMLWQWIHTSNVKHTAATEIKAQELGVPRSTWVDLVKYLRDTPFSARSDGKLGRGRSRMSSSYTDAVMGMGQQYASAKHYEIAWKKRITPAQRALLGTPNEWRIPPGDRPLLSQDGKKLIRCYPQDYEILSWGDYLQFFGGDLVTGMPPFEGTMTVPMEDYVLNDGQLFPNTDEHDQPMTVEKAREIKRKHGM